MSYCCMPNVQSIVSRHNKDLSRPTDKSSSNKNAYNCRVKNSCPLQGNCLANAVVYKALLDTKNGQKVYFGSCATTFKTRYNNHKQTFKDVRKRNATELSKAVWREKDLGHSAQVSWCIVKQAPPYICGAKTCYLCLEEKLTILQSNPRTALNKRYEMYNKCRHRRKKIDEPLICRAVPKFEFLLFHCLTHCCTV